MDVMEYKKRRMKSYGIMAAVLGVALFFVFWAATGNLISLVIIPLALIMGLAQAYLMPVPEEDLAEE